MRRLLTGYAGYFNRRHRRHGHLFQNRYKSILVEEEAYFLELVRYIHLNPLRARIVPDLMALGCYPWCGHSALLGRVARPWQSVEEVLGQFGSRPREARRSYHAFVSAGVAQGRRPELQGGGLKRSAGGLEAVVALRRGREHGAADERILGSGEFVEQVHRLVAAKTDPIPREAAAAAFPGLLERCATAWEITPAEMVSGARRRAVAHARAVVCRLAVLDLGLPVSHVARALCVSPSAVQGSLARGQVVLAARGLKSSDLLSNLHK
jgi:hypothetical protein